jgi:hypothetical protein
MMLDGFFLKVTTLAEPVESIISELTSNKKIIPSYFGNNIIGATIRFVASNIDDVRFVRVGSQ